MTVWVPDTCKCIIVDHQKSTAAFVFRCKIHQTSTVNQIKTHNKRFSIGNYNLPVVAWRLVKENSRSGVSLTVVEQAFFARASQMATDKATEKATT